MGFFAVHRNGRPATADDLAPLAFAGNAHFTAMQVRDRRVRGLDLHLARLRDASHELFGTALPDDQVRAAMRVAIQAGPAGRHADRHDPSRRERTGPAGPDPCPRVTAGRAAGAGGVRVRAVPPGGEARR
ncbi:hypothetical protein [Micromonospora sp. WMMD980]|uniref:hypothetical protein n=1 Tax=Micromonospora sp. WMMD980 TaxID=3016088 RepID=UPI0024177A30|nr:hypothetical protein [Micromonospora sp. WMMD980]MDG4803917.1 hypothetical protein [Micromonospora sp. WMMD980]